MVLKQETKALRLKHCFGEISTGLSVRKVGYCGLRAPSMGRGCSIGLIAISLGYVLIPIVCKEEANR